jgi:zeaxanthin epoxidase
LTFAWKPLLQYVIFPLQFAYLYSYHPTGNIAETAAALEAVWKEKHFKDAEAVFAEVEAGTLDLSAGPSFFQKAEIPIPETAVAE